MEKQLPKNWVESTIPDLITNDGVFNDGDWIESKDQDPKGEVRLIQLADIGKINFIDKSFRFLNENTAKNLKCTFLKQGDILIARMPDPIGRACIFPLDGKNVTAVDVAIIRLNKKYINNKWLMYMINSLDIYKEIQSLASGSTRLRISRKNLSTIKFPLPPLTEQNRIVTKLDALFAQLETIKSSMVAVPLLLKDFRQQVLTQTVTGKLKPFKKSEVVKLNDLGIWKGGGTPSKSNSSFWENGTILWTTAKDMKELFLSNSMDKITESAVKGSSAILIPKNSILIVTRSGILRRILPISSNTIETTVNQDLKVLIPNQRVNYKFLLYALRGLEEDIRVTCMKSGTTVESVEFPLLKNYEINLPSLLEQQEIVSRVESLFTKADAIEKQYESLKAKIDNLPQALLHNAFKGELTEQLESDGDARELLKEIEALKAVSGKVKKSGKALKGYEVKEEVLGMVAEG
jgi:type I restriction enzyme S subunit